MSSFLATVGKSDANYTDSEPPTLTKLMFDDENDGMD